MVRVQFFFSFALWVMNKLMWFDGLVIQEVIALVLCFLTSGDIVTMELNVMKCDLMNEEHTLCGRHKLEFLLIAGMNSTWELVI